MSIIEKAIDKLDEKTKVQMANTAPIRSTSISPYNDRIHIDIERFSGLINGSDNGILPYLADEYRRIKRPLLSNAFGDNAHKVKNGNLILITSAMPGEGKSFTATNLALSMATERDRNVLLIDGDVSNAHITHITELISEKGLIDLLLDGTLQVDDVLLKTDFPSLTIIPTGSTHPHTTELLASDRMTKILSQATYGDPNRIVIVDAPPLLVTPETQILCDRMGQIALVVEMGVTPKHIVERALAMIADNNKSIGLILNKSHGLT